MRSFCETVAASQAEPSAGASLGDLPQWRLEDLYESMESARFAADLERAQSEAKAFAERWRGGLAAIAASPQAGERLGEAVSAYEALQDLIGRVSS
ncbi:MAG TPA: oligoendopeptidase F, partial [Roseiarcus sp.]|nr:oligoendopeptidase F [Roseiarcus sp.]